MRYSIILALCCYQIAFGQTDTLVQPFLAELTSSFPSVRDITLSTEGDEVYFSAQSLLNEVSVILCATNKDDKWSTPKIATFSGQYHDLEPFLSPDGLRLFFVSNRPLNDTNELIKDYDIWYVERTKPEGNWSKPVNLGAPVNSEYNEFYPSVSSNNNLYFTSDLPSAKGKDDIFLCTWDTKAYKAPISLSDSINTAGYEFNSFIAPDESYIIFSGYNRKDGLGSGDLYISYKNKNGLWQKAQNMGKTVNSKQMDYCPFVDIHTNTLYFTSKRSSIKSSIDHPFSSIKELTETLTQHANGKSRLYKVSFNKQ